MSILKDYIKESYQYYNSLNICPTYEDIFIDVNGILERMGLFLTVEGLKRLDEEIRGYEYD